MRSVETFVCRPGGSRERDNVVEFSDDNNIIQYNLYYYHDDTALCTGGMSTVPLGVF